MKNTRPKVLVSLYYCFIFIPTGIGISFFPLWLRESGISVLTLGLLSAAGFASKVLVNPLASYWSSRLDARIGTLIILSAASALITATYVLGVGPSILAVAFLLVGILASPIMPLGDAVMLSVIRTRSLAFGNLRLWGSLAVLVTILVTGLAFQLGYKATTVSVVPISYVALLFVFVALRQGTPHGPKGYRFPFSILKDPGVLTFVCCAAPLQAVHGLFYGYSTLYWFDAGITPSQISLLWAVGIAAEVTVFFLAGKFRSILEPWTMVMIAAFAGVARWGTLSFTTSLEIAFLAQLLQGFTLSLLQVGVAEYFIRNVSDEKMADATSSYSAFAYGIFQALAVSVGGLIFTRVGGGHVFSFAAVICVLCGSVLSYNVLMTRNTLKH